MRKRIPLILIGLFCIFSTTQARISLGLNHPELIWSFRQTPHFKIIWHQGTEKLAEQAALVAEEVFQPISIDLGVAPSGKITIIISDYDDLSNGLATPLGHEIFIWAKSMNKYTTDSMTWLRRVVAHELTHQIFYFSQRNFFGTPWELFALGTTSTWFTEGLAQYEAERWDDHRDLLLKVAAHSNALLPQKRLEGFLGGDAIQSRLVYEQGHSLVRFIADKYGADKIQTILRKQRQFPASFNLALKRTLGVSEKKLIQDWQKQVQSASQQAEARQEILAEKYTRFPDDLQANYGVRWSPDGKLVAVVGIESFREDVTRLYVFDASGKMRQEIDGPKIGSYFSWSPDGGAIVYSKLRRGANGRLVNDLMCYDLKSESRQALTQNLRATDPVWSPDGKEIIFCQHQGPYSNLVRYEIATQSLTPLTAFDDWTEVFSPAWKPDGSAIAFSFIGLNGWRNVATISRDGREFSLVTNTSIDTRTPVWSPDGEKLAFISYVAGQPNLCVRDMADTTQQFTAVYGGLFNPAWTPDGTAISVVAFEQRDSVHVYTLPIAQMPPVITHAKTQPTFAWHTKIPQNAAPIPILGTTNPALLRDIETGRYYSLFHVRPQLTLPNLDVDDHGWQVGIYNQSADPLGKHTFVSSVTRGRRLHFAANYCNRQLLPTINLFISQSSYHRGTFHGSELWEKGLLGNFNVQFPFNFGQNLYANHLVWLGGDVLKIANYDPNQYQDFPVWAQPFTGWINTLNFGYAYSIGRPSTTYDVHPDAGFQFVQVTKRAEKRWGSDLTFTQISLATVIRTRTWLRRHILALKTGYFGHAGGQRIQFRYAMGNAMVRGLEPSIEGTQMLFANLDYRFPVVSDIGLKIWFVYLEGLYGGVFADVGRVWGDQLSYSRTQNQYVWLQRPFSQSDPVGTFGAELRLRIYLAGKIALIVQGGIARRWDHVNARNYYYLIGPVF
jgi:hypothetical protein